MIPSGQELRPPLLDESYVDEVIHVAGLVSGEGSPTNNHSV
jgi:hypothetical protein